MSAPQPPPSEFEPSAEPEPIAEPDPAADPAAPADPHAEPAPADLTAPHAARFGPLPEHVLERWSKFCTHGGYFPERMGMVVEELRRDYSRLRLPWRPTFRQRTGVMHGGVIAALVDTTVVPAIAAHYEGDPRMGTINLAVQYLRPVVDRDLVAEAWVEHRGRSVVFCRAEVRSVGAGGEVDLAATATLVFRVSASAVPVDAAD
ncbi:MAG: PaaI family thioesterase [bacterium]|nr:PaaI family thioesterase [bacterium]MXV90848.1 PaaI family thioesterase [Acidimicrobiia bacterium]MYC44219.1 PaaI family thioesterase [Acidimicrobiia bacterium]